MFRYFFSFPAYERNDLEATRFAEAVLYTASLVSMPVLDSTSDAAAFRVPKQLLAGKSAVSLDDLATLEESRDWRDRIAVAPYTIIGSGSGFADFHYKEVWKLVPAVYSHPNLFDAVRFLTNSRMNFLVMPGQIRDVLSEPEATALSGHDQTHLETALLEAFKAVEAVLGDPPKDERKLAKRLKKFGLRSEDLIGYAEARRLDDTIRQMNRQRDRKSAHGSTPSRDIRVIDLMDYQSCAEYVVLSALHRVVENS